MTISSIKQQERLKGRYSVYIDGKYAFSLSADALLEAKLTVGQELDTAQLKAYEKLSVDDKAYTLALAYAVRRMRSRYDLDDYFRRKGYDTELSQYIMQKLEALGLVDDEKFAEAWVRNRRLLKLVSKRRLVAELRAKRVVDDIITRVLVEDETDEQAVLSELIARRRKQSRYQDDKMLMQYLVRQGFSYDAIKVVLHES